MKTKKNGFTLIEIMIAIAILMALALFAIPSLKERKARSHVDAAVQVGLKDAQFMQKWYTITGRYSKDKGGNSCPEVTFKFYPEQSIESKVSNYQIKIESMYFFTSTFNLSTLKNNGARCQEKNHFTIIGYPICGTIVESMGAICIDQDGNVKTGGDIRCGNQNSLSPCINRDQIPDEGNNPNPNPDNDPESEGVNPDDIPEPSYCLEHPYDLNCQTPKFCEKYSNHEEQFQCKCVLDYRSDPRCKSPIEDQCTGERAKLPSCACSKNNPFKPEWCKKDGVDCTVTPDAGACRDQCSSSGGTSSPFCSCWDEPDGKECQDACKNSAVAKRPTWCKNDNDYCIKNHANPECKTDDMCKKIGYATDECKCKGSNQPDWCKNIRPDDDFCQIEVNKTHPSCIKDNSFKEGDITKDKCNNIYVCVKATLCNSKDEKYSAGTGSNWQDAWKLKTCFNGSEPNYPFTTNNGVKTGDIAVTLSCEKYRAISNINKNNQLDPAYQPEVNNSVWMRYYSSCHVDDNKFKYKAGDKVVADNGNTYTCDNEKLCNLCNPNGSDITKEGCTSTSGWRQ